MSQVIRFAFLWEFVHCAEGVHDTTTERVEWEFSSAGTYLSLFAVPGLRYGIAIDANGDIWVSEYYADCAVEFSPMGSDLGSFGGYGTGDGLFNIGPAGILIEQRSIHVDGGELDARDQESGEGVALQSASVAMHIIGIKQKRRYSLSA